MGRRSQAPKGFKRSIVNGIKRRKKLVVAIDSGWHGAVVRHVGSDSYIRFCNFHKGKRVEKRSAAKLVRKSKAIASGCSYKKLMEV